MDLTRPWHRLNINIDNALHKDFDPAQFYQQSQFAGLPGGVWTFNRSRIGELFSSEWLDYMRSLNMEVGSCVVFYRTPHYVHATAHVDTFADYNAAVYALNWTLDPKDNSDMVWYNPPEDFGYTTVSEGIPTKLWPMEQLVGHEYAKLIVGKQMTMINVTYPHNIIVRERERWAFSVRLTPEANAGINTWADAVDKHQHFILQ